MKKIFILFPILTLLVAGCSLAQKPVIDNSASNQPASSSQEQADNLNAQVQDLKEKNDDSLTTPNQTNTDWIPFKSSYFTLSFEVPSGFEVKEAQNHILIAKSPYYTRAIGDDNAFFYLSRYDEGNTRESKMASYKKLIKNWEESQVTIDGSLFSVIRGTDYGRFEGDSAGQVTAVFFNASWLEIIERPANENQNFDPIAIGNEILATFKFSK